MLVESVVNNNCVTEVNNNLVVTWTSITIQHIPVQIRKHTIQTQYRQQISINKLVYKQNLRVSKLDRSASKVII